VAGAAPVANGDLFVVCLLGYDDPSQSVPSKIHARTLGTGFESLDAIAHEIRRRLDGRHVRPADQIDIGWTPTGADVSGLAGQITFDTPEMGGDGNADMEMESAYHTGHQLSRPVTRV
jgi:hypothetical protein